MGLGWVHNPWARNQTTQQKVSSRVVSEGSFICIFTDTPHCSHHTPALPPVRSVVALDSHRTTNPTVNCACEGSRLRAPFENLMVTISSGAEVVMPALGSGCKYRLSLAERFDCTETIINQSLADAYQNPVSEWQVTIKLPLVAGYRAIPPPLARVCGKIVFHETGLWCQKGWRLMTEDTPESNDTLTLTNCVILGKVF